MNVAGYLAASRRPSRTDALRRAVAASATVLEHHRARRTLFLLCLLFFGLHLAPSQGRDAGFIERTVKERGLEGTSQRPRAAAKPPLDVDFLKRNRRLVLFWNRANQGGGGAEEDRTPDPLRARQVLSQLSYGPDLVGLGGLEPPASPLSGVRSNQLSYRPLGDLLARRLPNPTGRRLPLGCQGSRPAVQDGKQRQSHSCGRPIRASSVDRITRRP